MLAETEDEYRRLLYVAMTRAADRLIVGGCMPGNMNNVRKLCWYDLIARGLAGSGLEEQTIETPDGPVKRYARAPDDAAPSEAAAPASEASPSIVLPSWLRTPVASEPAAEHRLRPSDGGGTAAHGVGRGDQPEQRARAMQRGTLVHRLLQSLPGCRRAAAARGRADVSGAERRPVERGRPRGADREGAGRDRGGPLCRRCSQPAAAPRSPSSAGCRDRASRRALVSGQIDRLVVTEAEVLIVDFKTNLAAPTMAADAPPAYVRQLALYRAVLRQLYPDAHRARRAALDRST